jgi:hypothetical protein
MCSAIHTKSRSWLRSSSTREPSDPLLRVVIVSIPAPSPGRSSFCVQAYVQEQLSPDGKEKPANLRTPWSVQSSGGAKGSPKPGTSLSARGCQRLPPLGNRTPSEQRSATARQLNAHSLRGIAARSKPREGATPKVRRAKAGASLQT